MKNYLFFYSETNDLRSMKKRKGARTLTVRTLDVYWKSDMMAE
jgi:hypothetical protein